MKRTLTALLLAALTLTALAAPAFAAELWEEEGYTFIQMGELKEVGGFAEYPETPEGLAARQLYCLGLFQGTSVTEYSVEFSLEKTMNRQEAVTMLVRLLGKEREALSGDWAMPFADVDAWARPYVGYAYANGLTRGQTDTSFGGKTQVSANQYLTFILRALGYSDTAGDFSWNDPTALAKRAGVLSPCLTLDSFQRGDAALISNDALHASLKGTDETLLEKLRSEGAAERRALIRGGYEVRLSASGGAALTEQLEYCLERFGELRYAVRPAGADAAQIARTLLDAAETAGGYVCCDSNILSEILREAEQPDEAFTECNVALIEKYGAGYGAAVYADTEEEAEVSEAFLTDFVDTVLRYNPAPEFVIRCTFFEDPVTRYVEQSFFDGDYSDYITYADQMASYEFLYGLYHDAVEEGMSDYEKVKALYGALAGAVVYYDAAFRDGQTLYDMFNQGKLDEYKMEYDRHMAAYASAYSWTGVKDGRVVCEGYAEALELLLNMAGLPCTVVSGGSGDSGHAWNKVYLEGAWYNLDATWDDTGGSAGTEYFLKSDASYRRDGHRVYTKSTWYNAAASGIDSIRVIFETTHPAPKDYRP